MQSILSVSSEALENLAKMADKIAEVRSDPLGVCTIAGSSYSKPSADSPLNEMSALRAEIAALSKKVDRMSRARSNSRSRGKYFRSPHRKFESNEFCFYHQRFGKKARKCNDPCTFVKERQEN